MGAADTLSSELQEAEIRSVLVEFDVGKTMITPIGTQMILVTALDGVDINNVKKLIDTTKQDIENILDSGM
jgi:predicted regulator of Ras-like GTPase activity (Roadblock/LC7/MglB family)